MKKLIISLLAIVAVSAAFATPTILGQTGSYAVSNAYVTDNVVAALSQNFSDDFNDSDWPTVSLTVPLGNIVEVSGVYASMGYAVKDANNDRNGNRRGGGRAPQGSQFGNNNNDDVVNTIDGDFYGFGAKVAVPVNFFSADLALGGGYYRADGVNEVSAYAAVSKEIVENVVLTGNVTYFTSEDKDSKNLGKGKLGSKANSYKCTCKGKCKCKNYSNDTNDGFVFKFNIDAAISDNVNLGADIALGNTEFSLADRYFGQKYASTANIYADFAATEDFSIRLAAINLSHNTDLVVGAAYAF